MNHRPLLLLLVLLIASSHGGPVASDSLTSTTPSPTTSSTDVPPSTSPPPLHSLEAIEHPKQVLRELEQYIQESNVASAVIRELNNLFGSFSERHKVKKRSIGDYFGSISSSFTSSVESIFDQIFDWVLFQSYYLMPERMDTLVDYVEVVNAVEDHNAARDHSSSHRHGRSADPVQVVDQCPSELQAYKRCVAVMAADYSSLVKKRVTAAMAWAFGIDDKIAKKEGEKA